AGVAGHVLLVGRIEDDAARRDGDLAAFRNRRAAARQHVDAFLESVVEMRAARRIARLRRRDLRDPEGDARANLARHRLERDAAWKPEPPPHLPADHARPPAPRSR